MQQLGQDAASMQHRQGAAASTSGCPLRPIEEYSEHAMLHEGRHSTVWSAVDPATQETVVIKSYCKTRMKPRHAQHVVRETRLLQLLRDARCRGVVKLRHAYEDDECVHLVFEPCMRGDLYQLMTRQHGKLQEAFVACQVVAPLLSTLAFLHELNIVHRDVKTENIFLSSNGELQLGDFGLVAHKLHDQLLDRVGTLDYMAPEVLSLPPPDEEPSGSSANGSSGAHSSSHSSKGPGAHTPGGLQPQPYDEKVDIWAVGVLLYELLLGRPPFEVEDPAETARLILTAKVDSFPATVPADCIDFIRTALTRRPQERPSAEQLMRHAWLQRHLAAAAAQQHPHAYSHAYGQAQQGHGSWTAGPAGTAGGAYPYAHSHAQGQAHAGVHGSGSAESHSGGGVFASAAAVAAAAASAQSHAHGGAHQRHGDHSEVHDQGSAPHHSSHTSMSHAPHTQSHSPLPQHNLCDLDVATLSQQIDDAWRIDELERVMAQLAVGCPTGPGEEQELQDTDVADASDATCCPGGSPMRGASGGGASASISASAGAGTGGEGSPAAPSAGSCGLLPRPACLVAMISSPKTPGPSSGRESPSQSPASPSAWARQAREGLCNLRTASYQVLGKDLAHSAAVCHHTLPAAHGHTWHATDAAHASGAGSRGYPLTSSLSDTFWEGAAAAAGGGGAHGGGGGAAGVAGGLVEVSSRSFTSGVTLGCSDQGGSRSGDASGAGTPAWQRSAPQKAAGRSRFAS